MKQNRLVALAFVVLTFGMGWANLSHASDGEALSASAQKNARAYEGLAKAGYPIETILAIANLTKLKIGTLAKIDEMSKANSQLAALGYRQPFLTWWPWEPPKGHPDGSLWLLSQYLGKEGAGMKERSYAISDVLFQAQHTLRDINVAIESADAVSYAEASIQGQIFLEDRAIKEKYGKLAREIGAKPPWEMLTESAIREAMKAKR